MNSRLDSFVGKKCTVMTETGIMVCGVLQKKDWSEFKEYCIEVSGENGNGYAVINFNADDIKNIIESVIVLN